MTELGIEVWRGGVNPWQCDQMGHLNVRFYVAHATEALAGLAAGLGMSRAYAPGAASTLVVREHHIRYLKEARSGQPLHMTAGFLDVTGDGGRALQVLRHSLTDEPSALFQTTLVHAAAADAQPFAWSAAQREKAESLRIVLPDGMGPRSLVLGESPPRAVPEKAFRHGLGAFAPEDCDVFGRVRADRIMTRLAEGAFYSTALTRQAVGEAIGMAVVEYRLTYLEWPRAGDRVEVRSGWTSVEARRLRSSHWVMEPGGKRIWALAEAVVLPFDLEARKALTMPDEAVAALRARMIPGLA